MSHHLTDRRSRSPIEHSRAKTQRSRSPHNQSSSKRIVASRPVHLPYQAPQLSKDDSATYKSMFGLYLDIQKHLFLDELPKDEVKGRWKSFIGKWNRGELAEGWYDPATLRKAQASAAPTSLSSPPPLSKRVKTEARDESSDDDAVGPSLPNNYIPPQKAGKRSGPAIPNLQDLELKRELANEDFLARRKLVRQEWHDDRKVHEERLEELLPRAETGSKERMLEKKREKADSNRTFASTKTEGDGVEDVTEADLLGDDGGIEGFKLQKREMERRKNEREIRREEILRARQEEREQRVNAYKAKEEKTMSGLIALAKARFGS